MALVSSHRISTASLEFFNGLKLLGKVGNRHWISELQEDCGASWWANLGRI